MRDSPMLVTKTEVAFQLSLESVQDVDQLVLAGELVEVEVRGQRLIIFDSITAFVRRARRRKVAAKVV